MTPHVILKGTNLFRDTFGSRSSTERLSYFFYHLKIIKARYSLSCLDISVLSLKLRNSLSVPRKDKPPVSQQLPEVEMKALTAVLTPKQRGWFPA